MLSLRDYANLVLFMNKIFEGPSKLNYLKMFARKKVSRDNQLKFKASSEKFEGTGCYIYTLK